METDENKEEKLNDDNILNKKVDNKISEVEETLKDKKGTIKDTKEKNELSVNDEIKPEKKKEILKKVSNIFFIVLFNIVFPYIIYLASNLNNNEFYSMKNLREEMAWEFLARLSQVMKAYGGIFISFAYEFAMIYGLYFFFKAIFRKSLRSNIALAIVFNVISIISYYKIGVVEKPFWPEDILLIGNAMEIAGYGNITLEPIIIIQVFISVAILVVQWLITKYSKYEGKLKNVTRIIMGIVATVVLCVISLFNWTEVKGFEENNYIHEEGYYRYGANVEFFRNLYKLVEKPKLDIYSEERLEQIKEKSETLGEEDTEKEETPNIIAIMVESLSDITKVNSLEFEKDPLPTYRSLLEDYPNGNIVASIYAGETSMSEFEFLTGSSTRFLNGKKYPYSQILKNDTISIVSVLKNQGYYTTAIHANGGEFYNRDKAYEYLGFDKMVFEDDMQDIENIYDDNISDMDTAEEIVKQYEDIEGTKKFIFAITKELHSPLSSTRYSQYDIDVRAKANIPDNELSTIKVYTQGLYNFDQSLKYLLDYFEQKEEKVMIVFFGDHLPGLNSLYDLEYGEGIGRYETPYVIWTNYEMGQKEIEKYSKDKISIAGLLMMTLEAANIDLPWYYDFINEFYKQYPVCTNKFLVDKDGNELSIDTNNELIEDYNIIVFDLLYEKNIAL